MFLACSPSTRTVRGKLISFLACETERSGPDPLPACRQTAPPDRGRDWWLVVSLPYQGRRGGVINPPDYLPACAGRTRDDELSKLFLPTYTYNRPLKHR